MQDVHYCRSHLTKLCACAVVKISWFCIRFCEIRVQQNNVNGYQYRISNTKQIRGVKCTLNWWKKLSLNIFYLEICNTTSGRQKDKSENPWRGGVAYEELLKAPFFALLVWGWQWGLINSLQDTLPVADCCWIVVEMFRKLATVSLWPFGRSGRVARRSQQGSVPVLQRGWRGKSSYFYGNCWRFVITVNKGESENTNNATKFPCKTNVSIQKRSVHKSLQNRYSLILTGSTLIPGTEFCFRCRGDNTRLNN